MNALVDFADWQDPTFLAYLRLLEEDPLNIHRKPWEFARMVQSLDEGGLLDDRSSGLGLGCGDERLMYFLANRCRKVVATDLYDPKSTWSESRMLADRLYDSCPLANGYRRDHLEIRNMDMLEAHRTYPAEHFDFVWSTSSIEHVDDTAALELLFKSVNCVLKTGGRFVFATEWHADGPYRAWPNLNIFSPSVLARVARIGRFELVGTPPPRMRPATRVPEHRPIRQEEPGWTERRPHLFLSRSGTVFTSAVITLAKVAHVPKEHV